MAWYEYQPRIQVAGDMKAGEDIRTISQHFTSRQCVACGEASTRIICGACRTSDRSRAVLSLTGQIGALHNNLWRTERVCLICSGNMQMQCDSLDCPVYYRRRSAINRERIVPLLRELLDDMT